MIIIRVPLRISFFGGGTDYPAWYRHHGGAVISTTIDKFCYISARQLPPFFNHRIRLAYSQVEHCKTVDEIQHPGFREILRYHHIEGDVELHYDADLPARSGMGSSSAFAVGLLHALHALKGRAITPRELALEAIYVEREMMKETVGSQDQVAVAHGGLNHIQFDPNDTFIVKPLQLSPDFLSALSSHLMLYFTGTERIASEIAKAYTPAFVDRGRDVRSLGELVDAALESLRQQDLAGFGRLLHEGWCLKRSLSPSITSGAIDNIYNVACSAGALGGKILGAGGGGFMLLFAPPERQPVIHESLKPLLRVPFEFEVDGSKIIYNNREKFPSEAI
jgi:D-glycero-alpha-D-manno-heptose-7-phosphate kinase